MKMTILGIWSMALAVTAFGMFVYLMMALFVKEKKRRHIRPKPKYYAIDEMKKMVKDKNTTEEDIWGVVLALDEYHMIPEKQGNKVPKPAKEMLDMIFTLSAHNHMNDSMRQKMFALLAAKNPNYAADFAKARR